uniref:ead/Ea22-like family protein n=1 Tax=Citrobacter freundii TaxID=546 RepID=UPI00129CA0AF|nr:ead/Ea22-like family protein [Citrobacter freundii]
MTALNKQALRDSALDMISVLGYIASFESEDIDGDDLELRFETEDGFDTGCTISITSQCQDASDVMQQLLNELEKEKGYASAYEGEKWHYHQLAESEGERANRAEAKLEAAEKRIAELEARTVTLPQYRNSPDMHTKQFYEAIGFNQGLDIFIEALRAAGIGVKGE